MQTEEYKITQDTFIKAVIDDFLNNHNIEANRQSLQFNKMYNWVLENNSFLKACKADYMAKYYPGGGDDNPLYLDFDIKIPAGQKNLSITIPKRKIDILEILCEKKINVRNMNIELKGHITNLNFQHIDTGFSCIDSTNYDFSLQDKYWYEQKYRAGDKDDLRMIRYRRVRDGNQRIDNEYKIFSIKNPLPATGNGKSESDPTHKQGYIGFNERSEAVWKTFLQERIKFIRVAASNNRVFCCGQNLNTKKFHFFWAQLDDSFPDEPGGISVPGVYVRKSNNQKTTENSYTKLLDMYRNPDNDQYKRRHPVWLLQVYGGHVFNLIHSLGASLEKIKEKIKSEQVKEKIKDIQGFLKKRNIMPVIIHPKTWYEIGHSTDDITEVLDIGVSNIERWESYTKEQGGEIHAWLYPRKIEDDMTWRINLFDAKALFNVLGWMTDLEISNIGKNIFMPNFTVHDGMGYNDGITTFYILVKTGGKYKILWTDEQEGFSEKWRDLHPNDSKFDDFIATLTHIHNVIEWYYVGGVKNFWLDELFKSLFSEDKNIKSFKSNFRSPPLDKNSRISVSRYLVAVSTDDAIYTISYHWGVTDFNWSKRPYPKDHIIFTGTLKIRDDSTLVIEGLYLLNDKYITGYWYQKCIKQSILKENFAEYIYSKKGFSHSWRFVSKEVYNCMDLYYNFGVYDAYDEIRQDIFRKNKEAGDLGYIPFRKNKTTYNYQGYDARCQYYPVKVKNSTKMNKLKSLLLNEGPQRGEPYGENRKKQLINPFFTTYDRSGIDLSIKIALRYDVIDERIIAVFINPYDDDIAADLQKEKKIISELFFDVDLTGQWRINGQIYDLEFRDRIRDYSPPSVKYAKLQRIERGSPPPGNPTYEVHIKFDNSDNSLRYVTVGALSYNLDKKQLPCKISMRHRLTKVELNRGSLYITLTDTRSEFFSKQAHVLYGTSVWFEDILGHKNIPEDLYINGTLQGE